jgi:hypothetical protein
MTEVIGLALDGASVRKLATRKTSPSHRRRAELGRCKEHSVLRGLCTAVHINRVDSTRRSGGTKLTNVLADDVKRTTDTGRSRTLHFQPLAPSDRDVDQQQPRQTSVVAIAVAKTTLGASRTAPTSWSAGTAREGHAHCRRSCGVSGAAGCGKRKSSTKGQTRRRPLQGHDRYEILRDCSWQQAVWASVNGTQPPADCGSEQSAELVRGLLYTSWQLAQGRTVRSVQS